MKGSLLYTMVNMRCAIAAYAVALNAAHFYGYAYMRIRVSPKNKFIRFVRHGDCRLLVNASVLNRKKGEKLNSPKLPSFTLLLHHHFWHGRGHFLSVLPYTYYLS